MKHIREMWSRLQERSTERKKVQKTIKELSRLTDKELHDIGINRGLIRSVAEGSYNV
jgi:uncharacterized protein YjiS (DUF1127 family)